MKKLTLEEITRERLTPAQAQKIDRFPIFVLLDNIRSLYNVGSIFRTADSARIEKLILSGFTGRPPRKEIDKTALGAVDTVPWEYHERGITAVRDLKRRGIPLIALEHTSESQAYWHFEYPFPCCLIIGNEVNGIQEEILNQVDTAIEIPMFGAKHSLNVSVAFGIAVYEMVAAYLRRQTVKNKLTRESL